MYGWAKGLGVVGMVGALLLIIGMMLFDVTANSGGYAFDSEDTFQYIAIAFGVLTMLQGIGFLAYGAKTKGVSDATLGVVALVAGAVAMLVLAEPTIGVSIGDAGFSKDIFIWMFIIVAVIAVCSAFTKSVALCAFAVATIILASLTLFTDQIMGGRFCIVVAALVAVMTGCLLFVAGWAKPAAGAAPEGSAEESSEETQEEGASAEEAAAESAEEPSEETQEESPGETEEEGAVSEESAEEPSEETQEEGASAEEAAAESAEEASEESAEEPSEETQEEGASAEEAAAEGPSEETQEEGASAEEAAAEESAEGAEDEEIPELPKMVSSKDAADAARKAKESAAEAEAGDQAEASGASGSAAGGVVVGVAVAGAASAGSSAEDGSEEESIPSLEELGIEPHTPAVDIRRACWNRGLRCRRDYGEYAIPIAFVTGKVAVYPDEGEADHTNDKALEDDGWTVFHFPWAEVTDGQAEADQVEVAVKANLKSQKASRRGKKRRAGPPGGDPGRPAAGGSAMDEGTVSGEDGAVTTTAVGTDSRGKPKTPVKAILESGRRDIAPRDRTRPSGAPDFYPFSIILNNDSN